MRREPFNATLHRNWLYVTGSKEFVFDGLIIDFADSGGIGWQSPSYHGYLRFMISRTTETTPDLESRQMSGPRSATCRVPESQAVLLNQARNPVPERECTLRNGTRFPAHVAALSA